MSKKQFSIRLEDYTYARLNNIRWERRLSLNEIINEAVNKYLEEAEKDGHIKETFAIRYKGQRV